MRQLALAGAQVEFAEAKMAVGDEGPHSAWLGERQRVAIMGLSALGIESLGMGRDLAEQVQRMRGDATAKRSVCDGAFAQTLRPVELAQQQSSPSQRLVRPDSTGRLTLDELLALSEPRQRPARVAELVARARSKQPPR